MNLNISTSGYNVIRSGNAILYDENADLKFKITVGNGFRFNIILKFINDADKKQDLEKKISEDNTIIFICTNFNNTLGTGTKRPLPVATIAGKEWFLHLFVYGNDDKDAPKRVEYTILERE